MEKNICPNSYETIEIKKSKFHSFLFNVISQQEVSDIINSIKLEHKKATHICYAYKFTGESYAEKAFDDGEPSGTAGKPILGVINKKNLNNILIVVVRYYGGIKLGAGGLIRAYTNAASSLFK